MKNYAIYSLIACALAFGCKTAVSEAEEGKSLALDLQAKSGSKVSGKIKLEEINGEVQLTANISGLEPGVHAIHIHEKADCSSADGTSAGGHWNPTFTKHGKWESESYHKGDIGNFPADVDGNGTISFSTKEWCIGCGDPTKDILGKSIIIHEGADDFVTQPTGDAGGRVACTALIQ